MGKKDRIKKKIFNYFFDHPTQRTVSIYTSTILLSALSGIIFAFGFTSFINTNQSMNVATGGFSGFTQSVVLLMIHWGAKLPQGTLQSILYFAINIPALLFAFFKIGKRFAITSAVNVGLSSLFIQLFSSWDVTNQIMDNGFIINSPLTRVLFAGICTGLSSGIALKGGTSCGGMDIVSSYFAIKKSTGVGKLSIMANCFVVLLYAGVNIYITPDKLANSLLIVPFSLVYFFTTGFVIDMIHVRNKKVAIEIYTKNDYMTDILISIFPHSATIMEGKGAFTGDSEHVIKMIVSSEESGRVVKVIKNIDPNAFVSIVPLVQVYGNFFIDQVE